MTPADARPQFTALASRLAGACRWGGVRNVVYVDRFDIERDGVWLLVEPALGSKGALFGVEVFAPLRHRAIGVRTRFTLEGAFERFGKAVGITREFQTGDPAFDRAVFIDSNARDPALARLLASSDVRRAIHDVLGVLPVTVTFGLPPATVEPTMDFIRASIVLRDISDIARLERLFLALIELARACDRPSSALGPYGRGGDGGSIDETPLPSRRAAAFVAGALVAIPVITSVALPAGYALDGRAAFFGVVAGATLWLGYGVVFALLFRGRSSSLPVFLGAWAVALAVVPALAFGAEALNRLLDSGSSSSHAATARFVVPNKGSGYVEVRATWLPGSPSVNSPNDLFVFGSDGVVPVIAVSRPGALGTPWLVSVRRVPRDDDPRTR